MSRCPSELQLEELLMAGEASPLAGHVAGCTSCRARLEEMRGLGEEFRREVYPLTVDAVAGTARAPRPRRWLLVLAPLPALAAAAIAFLVVPRSPPPDYVGIKGPELSVAVFVQAAGGARAVADGEEVPAGAALRFRIRPPAPCRLWLVSVDAAGQVSRLYPATGEAPEVGAGSLPGGAVLDGRPGPERIFAVCSPRPLAFGEVERAARQAAGGGEAAVRAARVLAGLPGEARQATVLIEKRR
jgi:hypothetical protein